MTVRRRLIQEVNRARLALRARGRANEHTLLVLAGPRTGSYLMLESLNRVPDVEMKGEVINPLSVVGVQPGSRERTLRHVKRSLAASTAPIVGAKLILSQLGEHNLSPVDFEVALPGVRWLVVYREELLAQYASYWRARTDGNWRGAAERASMAIEPAHFLAWSHRMAARYQEALDVITRPVCVVSYESFAADPARLFRDQLLDFVGAGTLPALPPIRRAASGTDLRVANWDVLLAEVGGLPRLRIEGRQVHVAVEPPA